MSDLEEPIGFDIPFDPWRLTALPDIAAVLSLLTFGPNNTKLEEVKNLDLLKIESLIQLNNNGSNSPY